MFWLLKCLKKIEYIYRNTKVDNFDYPLLWYVKRTDDWEVNYVHTTKSMELYVIISLIQIVARNRSCCNITKVKSKPDNHITDCYTNFHHELLLTAINYAHWNPPRRVRLYNQIYDLSQVFSSRLLSFLIHSLRQLSAAINLTGSAGICIHSAFKKKVQKTAQYVMKKREFWSFKRL